MCSFLFLLFIRLNFPWVFSNLWHLKFLENSFPNFFCNVFFSSMVFLIRQLNSEKREISSANFMRWHWEFDRKVLQAETNQLASTNRQEKSKRKIIILKLIVRNQRHRKHRFKIRIIYGFLLMMFCCCCSNLIRFINKLMRTTQRQIKRSIFLPWIISNVKFQRNEPHSIDWKLQFSIVFNSLEIDSKGTKYSKSKHFWGYFSAEFRTWIYRIDFYVLDSLK